tara:strand:+ start:1326 stop:1661 length:336 start_codon:yes stop_codon:yes gene_type:complete
MGQFIKIPKSTTDLTSFDLMHLFSGVAEILSNGTTTIQVRMIVENTASEGDEELPLYEITTSGAMTDAQRLQMIQNVSKAVQEATLTPNSVPSLVVVSGLTISSLTFRSVL